MGMFLVWWVTLFSAPEQDLAMAITEISRLLRTAKAGCEIRPDDSLMFLARTAPKRL